MAVASYMTVAILTAIPTAIAIPDIIAINRRYAVQCLGFYSLCRQISPFVGSLCRTHHFTDKFFPLNIPCRFKISDVFPFQLQII